MDKETTKLSKEKFQRVHVEDSLGEELSRPQLSYWKDAWIRLRKNKGAIAGLVVLTFIILLALLGPLMNDYGRDEANYDAAYLPPKVKGLEWAGLDGMQVLRLQGTSEDDAVERGLAGYEIEEKYVQNVETVSERSEERRVGKEVRSR